MLKLIKYSNCHQSLAVSDFCVPQMLSSFHCILSIEPVKYLPIYLLNMLVFLLDLNDRFLLLKKKINSLETVTVSISHLTRAQGPSYNFG